jgi:hypothetical protein
MMIRALLGMSIMFCMAGCVTVEGGFKYEYDGKVFRADGRTPAKGVIIRLGRPDAPEAPELPDKLQKQAGKYVDKSLRVRADHDGKYLGTLETVQGWKYSEAMGMHNGPTKPPEPPMLPVVIVYVQEKGGSWMGYRLEVPPERQKEAISGIRKVHLPDLLLPARPTTTQATTTQATTGPATGK